MIQIYADVHRSCSQDKDRLLQMACLNGPHLPSTTSSDTLIAPYLLYRKMGLLQFPAPGPLPKPFHPGIFLFSFFTWLTVAHPWDIDVSLPSPWCSSVQSSIIMVHTLYNPLCRKNHNCDLRIVCLLIWWSSTRSEMAIISCSPLEFHIVQRLAHRHTTRSVLGK